MPRVHVRRVVCPLWRKASTIHHNTTVAYHPLHLDTLDCHHSLSSVFPIPLRDTCTPEDARQHIETRHHAGASSTTTPSAAAYARRRWWYVYSMLSVTTASANAM